MDIGEAQLEMRTRFVGGFYGQLVSGVLWVASASLARFEKRPPNSALQRTPHCGAGERAGDAD
jgi:hypothetical protein